MKRHTLLFTVYCLLVTLLVACGGDAAATTVERYLEAKVAGDADTVQALKTGAGGSWRTRSTKSTKPITCS